MRINTLLGIKEVMTDEGASFTLRYYLIQDIKTEAGGREVYGVGVVKCRENGPEEREWLPGLTESKEKAEELVTQFMEGVVTPVAAAAAADDWAGKK